MHHWNHIFNSIKFLLSKLNPNRTVKKTLDDVLYSKEVVTGKDVIQRINEQEKRQKEFEQSVEEELRNRRSK